jgi:hypothetical protein
MPTRVTPYGTITIDDYGCDCRIEATGEQLHAWAWRPDNLWVCSRLAKCARATIELTDNGDLVDLALYLPGEKYAEDEPDITADELNAWINDVLTLDPGALTHLTT